MSTPVALAIGSLELLVPSGKLRRRSANRAEHNYPLLWAAPRREW